MGTSKNQKTLYVQLVNHWWFTQKESDTHKSLLPSCFRQPCFLQSGFRGLSLSLSLFAGITLHLLPRHCTSFRLYVSICSCLTSVPTDHFSHTHSLMTTRVHFQTNHPSRLKWISLSLSLSPCSTDRKTWQKQNSTSHSAPLFSLVRALDCDNWKSLPFTRITLFEHKGEIWPTVCNTGQP